MLRATRFLLLIAFIEEKYMLQNYIKPFEDEYLFSWLNRLAEINAAPILFNKHNVSHSKKRVSLMDFTGLANELNISVLDLIGNNTTFYAVAPFMSELSKDAFIQMIVNRKYGPKLFNTRIPKELFKRHKICPECAKKKIVKNSHLLPGVSCCLEHKVKLYDAGNNFDKIFDKKYESIKASSEEIRYAEFANELNKLKTDIHINRSAKNNYDSRFINAINSMMKECDSPKDIPNYLKKYEYKNGIKEYECPKCGTRYISTKKGKEIYGCPNCVKDKTNTEILKDICKNSEYEILGEYQYLTTPITVMRKGMQYGCLPKRILYYTAYSIIEERTIDEHKFDDFIVNRTPMSRTYEVICRKCGGTFNISDTTFNKKTYCRICGKLNIDFNKNKYKLIEFTPDHRVKYECKKCGLMFVPTKTRNKDKLCPFCTPKTHLEELFKKIYNNFKNNAFDIEELKQKTNIHADVIRIFVKMGYITQTNNKYYVQFKPKYEI